MAHTFEHTLFSTTTSSEPSGTNANAINNSGTIVGSFQVHISGAGVTYSGFQGTGGWNPVTNGSGGYLDGTATAINSSGVIAGYAGNSSSVQNAYITNSSGSDAVFMGSSSTTSAAYGINDGNSVVGSMSVSGSTYSHAFLAYNGSTTLTDLNASGVVYGGLPSGVTLVQATAINNDKNGSAYTYTGYIIGYSMVSSGRGSPVPHGFLLTPR